MTWPALEQRTNRAALRVFGSTQTNPARLGWKSVSGDLVEPGDEVIMGGVSAVATQTMFAMATPDVPAAVVGMPLQIGPRAWTIADARHDGRGMTHLYCQAQR